MHQHQHMLPHAGQPSICIIAELGPKLAEKLQFELYNIFQLLK